MERGKRIPLHDHSDHDSGGLVTRTASITQLIDAGTSSGGTGAAADLSDATPLVESGSGSSGIDGQASRADHVHPTVDLLHNFAATSDPTTDDDDGDGYAVGSRWVNTTSGEEFVCVDESTGAAVWTSTTATSSGMSNPMTTAGDIIVGGTAGAPARLAAGTDGHVLTLASGTPSWAASASGFSDPMTTRGDIIVRGASGTTRLALGASGYVLTSDGTDAAWAAGGGGGAPTTAKYVVGVADGTLSAEIVIPSFVGHPDIPPASPSAYDDEWDDASGQSGPVNGLDAKWTHTGAGGIAYAASRMIVTHAASSTDEVFYQSFVPGASTAFTIIARFPSCYLLENVDYIGIQVLTSAGAVIAAYDVRHENGIKFNRDNPGGASSLAAPSAMEGAFYMKVTRDASNNYAGSISFDGLSWITPHASASSATTVGRIGFRLGQTQSRSYKVAAIDFFRVT